MHDFAHELYSLAAPEARVLRLAYKIGRSGARISHAEALVIGEQMDDEGSVLIAKLTERTRKRHEEFRQAKAEKKAKAKAKRQR